MGKTEQPDLFGAKAARDAGFASVAKNAGGWRPAAIAAIAALPQGYEGTGEDIRLDLLKAGLAEPHHHNAWGEVTKEAIKRGLIHRTGELRNMRTKRSHARATPVYRRG